MKSALVLFLCVAVVFGITKRSARWDAHLSHLDNKRQAQPQPLGCNWQSRGEPGACTLQGVTNNDVLGRRASGLLAIPQNQGECGSCWAFAATHAYTDALSIRANSRTPVLGAQYPASCFRDRQLVGNGNGCCGGALHAGFRFFQDQGAVTESCAPYNSLLSTIESSRNFFSFKPSIDHTCPALCDDGTTFNPTARRLYGYRGLTTEAQVIQALAVGPVVIGISVTNSFKSYKCGVFCEVENDGIRGGHAMEIVDYGTENGVDFWVVKNSWGTDSGESGFYRIRRGESTTRGYVGPAFSGSDTAPNNFESFMSCAPTDVSEPTQDDLVMSAVEHVIDEINELNSIPCPENTATNTVSLSSVIDASTQVVNGVFVMLQLLVDVTGCVENYRAEINATVMLQGNNTFETTLYGYRLVADSGGQLPSSSVYAVTGSVAVILFAVAANIL